MALSYVDISNQALVKIGADTILDFTPVVDTKGAKLVTLVYKNCRDYVLRQHPWNCATKRVVLSPLAAAPAFTWSYQFTLPSDCLRVLSLVGLKHYKTEGRNVLCDDNTISLKYIYRVEDASLLDDMCADVISCRIAHQICYAMTSSRDMTNDKLDEYRMALRKAKFVDATEDPSEEFILDSWFQARDSGSTTGVENA